MSLRHAVVWTDHQSAEVLQFDDEQVLAAKKHFLEHPSMVKTQKPARSP